MFKGGGIRGLFFPGAFRGLEQKGAFRIGAFAGASAGAMIATIIWSGLRPLHLVDQLKSDSNRAFGLVPALFSTSDLATILGKFLALPFLVSLNFGLFGAYAIARHAPRLLGQRKWRFHRRYIDVNIQCKGEKFRKLINRYIVLGLQERGFNERLIEDYFGIPLEQFEPTFRDIQDLVVYVRDISQVGRDDKEGQEFLKRTFGEEIELKWEGIRYTEGRYGAQQNNVLDLMFDAEIGNSYFPPIFISVSCIDSASGTIIDNLDPNYENLKICDVVRASAGHPFCFKPIALEIDQENRMYTDGGVFSNLPATAASRAFTKMILQRKALMRQANDIDTLPLESEYDSIATSPFLTVGIGTEDIIRPISTTDKIRKMASGIGKDQVELELSKTVGGFSYLLHRTPTRPNYINFFAAKPNYIEKISRLTEDTILRQDDIRFKSQLDGSLHEDIQSLLEEMARIVMALSWVGGDRKDAFVRMHLFFEDGVRETRLDKKCVVTVNRKNSEFSDTKTSIVRENCGILGVSRKYADPIFCRIDQLQSLRRNSPNDYFLGLKYDEISNVPEELNFCFALPIFEYRGITYGHERMRVERVPEFENSLVRFDSGINGPISALISIDGYLPGFNGEIDEIVNNIRWSRLIGSLERHCLELSVMLHGEITGMVRSRTLEP